MWVFIPEDSFCLKSLIYCFYDSQATKQIKVLAINLWIKIIINKILNSVSVGITFEVLSINVAFPIAEYQIFHVHNNSHQWVKKNIKKNYLSHGSCQIKQCDNWVFQISELVVFNSLLNHQSLLKESHDYHVLMLGCYSLKK